MKFLRDILSKVYPRDKPREFVPEPWPPRCPDCGANAWAEGPSGGFSINMKCLACKGWFNMASWRGQTFFIERIRRDEHGRPLED